jgi:hypothetical protein
MKRLEKQLKALQDHLAKLGARADKARGQTRRRLKRLERRTRVTVERTVRVLEPKVRQAVAEAAGSPAARAGVRAGCRHAGVGASGDAPFAPVACVPRGPGRSAYKSKPDPILRQELGDGIDEDRPSLIDPRIVPAALNEASFIQRSRSGGKR